MPGIVKTILLLEEEPTLREITAFRLELLGYRLECFDTAADGMRWLTDHEVELIAVGHVNDVEPVELIGRLSEDPRTANTPLVFMSANSDLSEVQRAFNAGADEFLVTPYDPLVLEQKVEGLITAASRAK